MTGAAKAHRGTIHLEDARITAHTEYPGEQFILRVNAPECARRAVAGSFAHIRCDADIPMRRPVSIMGANPGTGEVDFLYKIVGPGLRALSRQSPGSSVSIMAPIGNGFTLAEDKPRKLMIGGGVGVPPMLFLATTLAEKHAHNSGDSLVLMGSEVPFPFELTESSNPVAGVSNDTNQVLAALEKLNVPSRLASQQGFPGVHPGYVTDLARAWLTALNDAERREVEVFACGPEPMLQAAAAVARDFGVPCQLCLEEYMACAVGGCAGCTVAVHDNDTVAMKRVCVDGPVFPAASIYP
jgi:dihydroorotate dehydrogenase electron transfer subunit